MDRRTFLKTTITGSLAAGFAGTATAAEHFFPDKVDMSLFKTINRVKNPAKKTMLEKLHAPVITAPKSVMSGEPFLVTVAIGETLHPMTPDHWIGFIELSLGNEPAGRADSSREGI